MVHAMGNRVVVKFGGADLSTAERIRKAAEMILRTSYKEVVVVVSAIGKTTDNLIGVMSEIGRIDDRDYAEIVSMGERTSARIFCSALKSLGANAVYVDPAEDNWPIITDSNFCDAKPDIEKTMTLVKKYLEPMLSESIPVVCGFLGRDEHGNITTLGRGGSDITALLIANCLEADEVILVKDTDGVLSADPKIVPNARLLGKIDIYEMFSLALGGAKIIRPEALKYKLPNQKLRILNFSSESLDIEKTEITGVFNSNSPQMVKHRNLSAISLVGDVSSANLSKLFSTIYAKSIYGVCTGKKSITVFTSPENANETVNQLHALGCFKAVSYRGKVGMIEVVHPDFIDSPGWIAKISSALGSKNINIIEVTTSKATINVFIDEEKLELAFETIGDVFEA